MSNTIPTTQNSELQLRRLAAQRHVYATAKKLFAWHAILGVGVAVVGAMWVLFDQSAKSYVAAWGITVSLFDVIVLTKWQKRLRNNAARIQEAFDCDVLELPWNALKAGRPTDPEFIKEQSDKYKKREHDMPTLKDWYSPAVGELPLHVARLVCQRSNCWWDSKQRRRYALWIAILATSLFLLVLGLSMKGGITIESFVLRVVAPLSPALLLGIRQSVEHIEAASRLDKLKEHSENLWNQALAGKPEASVTVESRNLQDEILENRRKSPLVFDWIFKRLRRDYEIQMNHAANEMVAEAKSKLST